MHFYFFVHTQWALAPVSMRFMCGFCNSRHATHTRLSVDVQYWISGL